MSVRNGASKAKAHAAAGGDGLDRHQPMFDIANLNNSMVGLVRMQALGMRTMLAQQQEMLNFLRHRCDQDLRLINTIVEAQAPEGMVEAVADFYRTAAHDYSEETGRSVTSGTRAAAAAGEATIELAKSLAKPPGTHAA